MKKALNEYKKLYEKTGFSNIEAWNEMKSHMKWAPVERGCGQLGGESSSSKRNKNNESGQYSTSNDTPNPDLPDLNEDSTPTHPTRRTKKAEKEAKKAESSSSTNLVEEVRNFKLMKESEIEAKKAEREELKKARLERDWSISKMAERQREMAERQKELLEQQQYDKDVEIFIAPHEHLTGPFLHIKLDQKRKIAAKYGWEINF